MSGKYNNLEQNRVCCFVRNKKYFGLINSFYLFNTPIFTFYRSKTSEEWKLFGIRLLHRPLPVRFELSNIKNLLLASNNSIALKEIDKKSKGLRILYIADGFGLVGGVETRLFSQAKYLRKLGHQPLVLTEKNSNVNVLEFPNFVLDFQAPNAESMLFDIVNKANIDIVEFQLKSPKFMNSINLNNLRAMVRVGACIHANLGKNFPKIDLLDYVIRTFSNTYPTLYKILNWIDDPKVKIEASLESDQVLFISRIDGEKFDTLKNFVKLCRLHNLKFKIAGTIDESQNTRNLLKTLNIPEELFIGPINTVEYLKEFGNQYCCVAGVGQVPLEVASLGLPAMVVPHKKDFNLATVLTEANFEFLRNWNCVIRLCPNSELLGNFSDFLKDKANGNIDNYVIPDIVLRECSIDIAMERYLDLIIRK